MKRTDALLSRLQEIANSLEQSGHGLALLGMGSVGTELGRLDEFYDLDFFAIVEPGCKQHFIDDLFWLTRLADISYCFKNTADGYKLLFADGIFCEFAVFEAHELPHIPYSGARVVWQRPGFDALACGAAPLNLQQPSRDADWLVGEALTNIYVGMGRYLRGERLSAMTFIQNYAFARILDLVQLSMQPQSGMVDIFARDRRFEQRYPALSHELPILLGGYTRTPEAAAAALAWLDRHFGVNASMKQEIVLLCQRAQDEARAALAVPA